MVGFVEIRVRDCAVGIGADGGFDVVFGRCEGARESEGGGDVFGSDEQCVVVCIWVFGEGVEGEVETGLVAHGWGFDEGVEGGGVWAWEAGAGVGDVVAAAGIGGGNERVFVCVV